MDRHVAVKAIRSSMLGDLEEVRGEMSDSEVEAAMARGSQLDFESVIGELLEGS